MIYKLNIRPILTKFIELPLAKVMNRCGLRANHITVISLALCIFSSYLVISQNLVAGGLVFFFGSCLDLFDGTLSRLTNTSSDFGSLLDSVCDRIGEAVLLSAIILLPLLVNPTMTLMDVNYKSIISFQDQINILLIPLGLIALISSQLVSYVRSKGENLGIHMEGGLMSRAERVILLSIGLVTGLLSLAITLMALLSTITLLQRIYRLSREIRTVVNNGSK